jgi:hypothetical protein
MSGLVKVLAKVESLKAISVKFPIHKTETSCLNLENCEGKGGGGGGAEFLKIILTTRFRQIQRAENNDEVALLHRVHSKKPMLCRCST